MWVPIFEKTFIDEILTHQQSLSLGNGALLALKNGAMVVGVIRVND